MPRPTKRNFKTKKRNVSSRKNIKKSMKGGLKVQNLINQFEGKQQKKTPPPVTPRKQKQIKKITPEPIYNNPEYGIPPNDKSRSGNIKLNNTYNHMDHSHIYSHMIHTLPSSKIGTHFPNIESIYNTNESSNKERIYNTIIQPIQSIQPGVYKQQNPLQYNINESIYETVNQNNLKKKEKRKKIYNNRGEFFNNKYIIKPPRKLTKKLGKRDYKNRVRKLAETVYGLKNNELNNNNKKVKNALHEILVNPFIEKTGHIIQKIKEKKEKKEEKVIEKAKIFKNPIYEASNHPNIPKKTEKTILPNNQSVNRDNSAYAATNNTSIYEVPNIVNTTPKARNYISNNNFKNNTYNIVNNKKNHTYQQLQGPRLISSRYAKLKIPNNKAVNRVNPAYASSNNSEVGIYETVPNNNSIYVNNTPNARNYISNNNNNNNTYNIIPKNTGTYQQLQINKPQNKKTNTQLNKQSKIGIYETFPNNTSINEVPYIVNTTPKAGPNSGNNNINDYSVPTNILSNDNKLKKYGKNLCDEYNKNKYNNKKFSQIKKNMNKNLAGRYNVSKYNNNSLIFTNTTNYKLKKYKCSEKKLSDMKKINLNHLKYKKIRNLPKNVEKKTKKKPFIKRVKSKLSKIAKSKKSKKSKKN